MHNAKSFLQQKWYSEIMGIDRTGSKGNKAAVPALDIAMGSRSGAGAGREDREGLSPEGSPQLHRLGLQSS